MRTRRDGPEMSYDLDAMQTQLIATMKKPNHNRFCVGASYDPQRRLRDYDYKQYGYKPENMTILGSSTSWTATVNAEAALHQRMQSHPQYDARPQQPRSLGQDNKPRYYVYFAWTDQSSKTTWERTRDLVAALLLRDPTGAEVVAVTSDEMFRMIRMGSPQYVLKIGPAQVHYHWSWCRHINFPLARGLKGAFASLSLQALIDEAQKPHWASRYRDRANWIPCEHCLTKSDTV
jgi:hypothetical protein